jgi:hypothetical protein
MRLSNFCLAIALGLGSMTLHGCKPQEKPADEAGATATEGAAEETIGIEVTEEPVGSG